MILQIDVDLEKDLQSLFYAEMILSLKIKECEDEEQKNIYLSSLRQLNEYSKRLLNSIEKITKGEKMMSNYDETKITETFDLKGCFQPAPYGQFFNKLEENVLILVKDEVIQKTKSELTEFLLDTNNFLRNRTDDNETEVIVTDNNILMKTKMIDLRYWSSDHRQRYKRVLSSSEWQEHLDEVAVRYGRKEKEIFKRSLACAIEENGKLVIKETKDLENENKDNLKKDILKTLNEWLDKYFLENHEHKLRLNLHYETDKNNFKSIDELVNEGTLVLC